MSANTEHAQSLKILLIYSVLVNNCRSKVDLLYKNCFFVNTKIDTISYCRKILRNSGNYWKGGTLKINLVKQLVKLLSGGKNALHSCLMLKKNFSLLIGDKEIRR